MGAGGESDSILCSSSFTVADIDLEGGVRGARPPPLPPPLATCRLVNIASSQIATSPPATFNSARLSAQPWLSSIINLSSSSVNKRSLTKSFKWEGLHGGNGQSGLPPSKSWIHHWFSISCDYEYSYRLIGWVCLQWPVLVLTDIIVSFGSAN